MRTKRTQQTRRTQGTSTSTSATETKNATETQTQTATGQVAEGQTAHRASRRRVLGTATKAAVATLAAGALVVEGASHGGAPIAHADGSEGPTVFTATGTTVAVTASAQTANAVVGSTSDTTTGSAGIVGAANSDSAYGVHGANPFGTAIFGDARGFSKISNGPGVGVYGASGSGDGVVGNSNSGDGVVGSSNFADGVYGQTGGSANYGVHGTNPAGTAILGDATNNGSGTGTGVQGTSDGGYGVEALSSGTALHAKSSGGNGVAARLEGLLQIAGAAVGQAALNVSTGSVTVPSTAVTASSLILLTPMGDPQGVLWVSNLVPGTSFQINVGSDNSQGFARQSVARTVQVAYLIIN